MSTRPFHNAGLTIDNARVHLAGLEYTFRNDPARYEELGLGDDYARTAATLRACLLAVRAAIDYELARLPPQLQSIPEKSAGYVSPSIHG